MHGLRLANDEVKLTNRESQVIAAIIERYTNRMSIEELYMSIGQQLGISPKTVETHCNNIRRKLRLRRILHLYRWAISQADLAEQSPAGDEP